MAEKIVNGILIDEQTEFTLDELTQACGCDEQWVVKLVEQGVIDPAGQTITHWRFSGSCLRRVHTATRLQKDLGVNVSGVALAIELLEEVENLRAKLRHDEL